MKTLSPTVEKKWGGIDQSDAGLVSLDDTVSWKITPTFIERGRSAVMLLDDPIKVETKNGSVLIERLKIKGVGLRGFDDSITHPCSDHLKMFAIHLSINPEGKFSLVSATSKPLGGIVIDKARTEYEVADRLYQNNIPTEIPIRLYHYTDSELFFESGEGSRESLGVVVAGQHTRSYDRADIALEYSNLDPTARASLDQFAKLTGTDLSIDPELSLFAAAYKSYAHYIRKFNKAGLYRHSGHASNIGLSLHTQSIYFTDIDSCRFLTECGDVDTPLQVMRDAISGYYNIIVILTEAENIGRFTPDRVIKSGIFKTYLYGYYDDLPEELINRLSDLLEEQYITIYHLAAKSDQQKQAIKENSDSDSNSSDDSSDYQREYDQLWSRRSTEHYEHIYSWLLAVFWVLHNESTIHDEYPLRLSKAEYFRNISNFSSPELVNEIQAQI